MPQGFKIASAWVEIKADTSGLRRDAESGVRRALAGIDARVRLAADSTGLRAQVRAAAKKAGAGESATIKIKTDFNVAEARAKMMAGIKGLNLNADVDINPDIDAALMKAKIQAEVNALKGRFTVPVTPDINASQFAAKLQAAARTVAASDTDIPVDLNPRINRLKLRAEAAAAAATVRASVTFNSDLKTAMLDAQVAAAVARLNAMPHNLNFRAKVDVDRNRLNQALNDVNRAFDSSGGHIGRWTKILLAVGTLGPPAIASTLPAIKALGTASLGLIPALTTLGVTFGAIAVGGNGVVNAITASTKGAKQFKQAMSKLTPTAQAFVKAIITSKGAFHELQQSVQNTLFSGLDSAFRTMARNTIPDLEVGLGGMALQLNDMTKLGLTAVTNLSRMGLLKTMFGGLQQAFAPLVPMPGQFLTMLTKLTIAATPLWTRMTTSMGRGMDSLSDKVNRLFETGLLQAKISKAGSDISGFFKRIANNPEWDQFVSRLSQTGPEMARALGDITQAVLKLINDAGPLAGTILKLAAAFGNFVTSLPDGLVTTLMSVYLGIKLIGVAGSLLGKVAGFVTKLGGALKVLVSQQAMIAAIGPALMRIGASAGVISKAATAVRMLGVAVGVLLAGKAIIDHFSHSAAGAAPNVDKLETSLTRLAKNGSFGGELKKTFGDIDGINEAFGRLDAGIKKNIGGWEKIMGDTKVSDWARGVVDNFKNGDKSIEGTTKKVDGLDKALADMVSNGYGDVASAAISKIGISGKDSAKYLDDYGKAVADQKRAEELAAASMGQFGDTAVRTQGRIDALSRSTDGLSKSLFALNDVNRDAADAQSAYVRAAEDATNAAKEHAGALKMQNGQLVISNQTQADLSDKANALAAAVEANGMAVYKSTGNWQQAQQKWSSGRAELEKTLVTMGLSTTQAHQYAAEILKIPTQKQINLQLKSDAQQQLDSIAASFRAAPDKKTIHVDVLDKPAIAILESLGFKVQKLPDGTFTVTAKTEGAKSQLSKLDKYKVKDKDVKVSANTSAFDSQIVAAQRKVDALKQKRKTAVGADKTALDSAITKAQAKVDSLKQKRAAAIKASDQTSSAARSAQGHIDGVHGKTVHISIITDYFTAGSASQLRAAHGGSTGGLFSAAGFKRFATGGEVPGVSGLLKGPGTKTSDSLIARLSTGEYVMRAAAVDKYGPTFMNMINSGMFPKLPRYAVGGYTKRRTVGKGKNKHTQYLFQGHWYDSYDSYYNAHAKAVAADKKATEAKKKAAEAAKKEKEARSTIAGDVTFSRFGQMAFAQGSFKHNEFENSLGKPGSVASLVDNLNKYKNLISASTHGKTESTLLKKLDSSGKALLAQQKKYEAVNKSLDAAKSKLDGLKDSFNQLKDSVSSNIIEFGNITKAGKYGTNVNTLINQLQGDTAKAQQFNSMLSQLKAKGLNATAISQIAEAGISGGGMATAQTLLGASAEDIKKINDLQTQLTSAANAAGTTVADSMYGAGIKAAQGLVDGLTSQQKAIEATMMSIAKSMEAAIKKALGIKSPSRVMMGLGSHVAEGFAIGIEQNDRPKVASLSMAQQSPAAVANTPTSAGGGIVINGGLTVQVEGTFDLSNPQQRKNIANNLADEIVKATRRHDRARS